jgi:hypothetical protein
MNPNACECLPAARRAIAGAVLLGAALLAAHGAIASERIALMPSGIGRDGDGFGGPNAVSGDTVAVGIVNARPDGSTRSGAIAVYRLGTGGWQGEAMLVSDTPVDNGEFGSTFALAPDLLVGAGYTSSGGGRDVETFVRSGSVWSRVDAFTIAGDSGSSIALSGDSLIVAMWSGAQVYARSGSGWALQTTLVGDQPSERIEQAQIDGDLATLVGSNGSSITRECFVHFFYRSGSAWALENTIDLGIQGMGCAVATAVSGQTVLVDALADPVSGRVAVNAYVRDQGTWSLQGPLDAGADYHGIVVALDGDRAVVGSPQDDLPGIAGAGTAYVFERSGGVWTRTQHLYDADAGYAFEFGSALALDGDTVVVGSPGAYTDAGRAGRANVLTLEDPTWTVDATLDDGTAHAGEGFGESVAGTASTLAVGAPFGPWQAQISESGAAYVFAPAAGGWILEATLHSTSPQPGYFGNAVALDGDTLAVGAPMDDDSRGAAYVYTREGGTWPEATRLGLGNDDQNLFAWSVALGGGWLFAGEPGQDFGGEPPPVPPGQVHVYAGSGSNWIDQGVLTPSASSESDEFGYALALSGNTLLVGAPRADDGIEVQAGLVFVFVNSGSTWTEEARLEAPVPASGAGFGVAVAIAGDTAVIGAGANYETQSTRGAAYVFHRTAGAWAWEATLAPAVETTGAYGHSVAISADQATATVGMPHTFDGTDDGPGRVFAFQKNAGAWIDGPTLQGSSTTALDEFGLALAFDGSDALVGAPWDGIGGAVYSFGVGDAIFAASFDAAP